MNPPTQYQLLIDQALDYANFCLQENGKITNNMVMYTNHEGVALIGMEPFHDDEQKDNLMNQVRHQLRITNANACIFISEVWYMMQELGAPPPRRPTGSLADDPRSQEAVMLLLETPEQHYQGTYPIIRNHEPQLGNPTWHSNEHEILGRLTNLLPCHQISDQDLYNKAYNHALNDLKAPPELARLLAEGTVRMASGKPMDDLKEQLKNL